jgi:CelD/BcsL family acetyltransferase involved in cellulose biosynthesis
MPDGGVTDYCAPILGPGAPLDDAGARALCRAVQEALSADGLAGDVLRFDKMPVMLDGRANPLLAGFATRPSRLAGNVVSVPGTWQQWLAALDRPVRKEIGRCRRLFEGKGGRFLVAATPAEAAPIMDALETLQAERIHGQGLDYILDEPANRAHYRQLVNAGLADGSAVLGALVHGEGAAAEVVAALLAITHRDGCCMVRLAQAGGAWRTLSPGRQVLERTMEHLHGQGFRRFDFTIGSYDYKRRLGAVPQPLVDVRHGLSWPGRAVMAAGAALHGMREAARKQEWLRAVARRFRGGR